MEKITWPSSNKVLNQFLITLVGIVILVIFFAVADQIISKILANFYA